MFAKWLVLWIDLTKGLCYVRRVLKCALVCLWHEFDCPEVTLCSWHNIKIQLLTNWLTCLFLKPARVYWQILHVTCQPVFNRTYLTELIHFGWTTGFNWGTQTNNKLHCFPMRKLWITHFDILPFWGNCEYSFFFLVKIMCQTSDKGSISSVYDFVDIIFVFICQLLHTIIIIIKRIFRVPIYHTKLTSPTPLPPSHTYKMAVKKTV